jgi:hypothetical protein
VAEPVELQVTAGIGSGVTTRTDGDSNLEEWANAAVVMTVTAINGTESTASHDDNVSYTIKDGSKGSKYASFSPTSGTGFVFDPKETKDVTFAALTFNNATTPGNLTKNTDGSSNAVTYKYSLSNPTDGSFDDVQFAKKTANAKSPAINFQFNHILSKLTIQLEKAEGVPDITAAELSGYITTGTVTITTGGQATISTDAKSGDGTATTIKTGTEHSSYILLPVKQTLKIKVTAGNNEYVAYIKDYEFTSGYAYNCVITLNKTTLTVGGTLSDDGTVTTGTSSDNALTIVKWTDASANITGSATMGNK